MSESTTFATALRTARRNTTDPERGGHLTQDRLAELIGQRLGMIGQPTGATIGNWERGISRPSQKDRDILIALIAILVKYGGLRSPVDANNLLTLGGYAPLTAEEETACFGEASPPSQPPNASATPFTVPYPPNPLFVGRNADLERLYDVLRPEASVALVPAVAGTGGIGKTQLAVEFAHQYRDRFPGGVFWLTMTDDASVRTQVAAYAGPGGLNLPGWQAMSFDDRIAAVRAAWQQPDARLLIFDNLEDPALMAWRPTTGGCRVLITSRRMTWHRHSSVEALPLDVLARDDSHRLLLTPRYSDRPVLSEELSVADAICEELGDLPLALALAAAYLEATPSMPLDGYLERLQTANVNHPSLNMLLDEGLPTGHAPSILATFDLSYARLDSANSTDALALRLLHCAAWCAPVAIPRRLLLRAAAFKLDDADTQAAADHALRRLAAVGLIELLPDGALRLHRLLAAYIRARTTDPIGAHAAVAQALFAESEEILDAGDPQKGLPYLEHLRLAVKLADPGGDAAVLTLLMNNLALLLYEQGDYAAARPLLEHILAIRGRVLGPNHPGTLSALNNLAELLRVQGDYAAARPLYERALAIRKWVLGPVHPDVATSLNNLALLLYEQRDYAAARPLYERALAIYERVLGPGHPRTANSLNNLALLLHAQGDHAAARPLYQRALAICERVLGPGHPLTATSLNNLALLLVDQGVYAEAGALLERALAIRERILGPDHPDTASGLDTLAGLLYAQGDYAAARPLYQRALAIRERVLGPVHPDTAASLNNLAELLHAQGDYAAACPLCERALAIREQVLGLEHLDTAVSANNLAVLLKAQGDYAAARPLLEHTLAIRERVLGSDHPDTASGLNNLAELLHAQGDYATARPLLERALAIRERVLGPDHPDIAISLNNLAGLLYTQGDYATARPLLERALAICERALEPAHPYTLQSLYNLAALLYAQGDYATARPLLERALTTREQVFRPEQLNMARSLHTQALKLHAQGVYSEAHLLYKYTLTIYERGLEPDHLDTAFCLNNLAILLRDQGTWAEARPFLERALAIFERVLGPNHPYTQTSQANLSTLNEHLRAGQT